VVSAWLPELSSFRRSLAALPARIRRGVAWGTVGVVETAIGATHLLAALRPRAVILVGTAGLYPGAAARLAIGDAAVAQEIVLLAETLPGRHAYLPEIVPRQERAARSLTSAIRKAAGLPAANVASPLAITCSPEATTFAAQYSGCALENLEAFALARAAASLKIPLAVVLGIANHVGPAAHREWKKNAGSAAAAACRAVLAYLAAGE
jgi:purine-nucleoside phosphorylase